LTKNKLLTQHFEWAFANEREDHRKLCAEKFVRFIVEMNAGTRDGLPPLIYPSHSTDEALDRFWPLTYSSHEVFDVLQRQIRQAGEAGNWKHAVLLATFQAQIAAEFGLNGFLRSRIRAIVTGVVGAETKNRKRLPQRLSRNEKLCGEWEGYKKRNGKSAKFEEFWPWMMQVRYYALLDKETKNRDPKFARQLKPKGKFLSTDYVRRIVRPNA
jgi:hypothetical protein